MENVEAQSSHQVIVGGGMFIWYQIRHPMLSKPICHPNSVPSCPIFRPLDVRLAGFDIPREAMVIACFTMSSSSLIECLLVP